MNNNNDFVFVMILHVEHGSQLFRTKDALRYEQEVIFFAIFYFCNNYPNSFVNLKGHSEISGALNFHKIRDFCILEKVLDVWT